MNEKIGFFQEGPRHNSAARLIAFIIIMAALAFIFLILRMANIEQISQAATAGATLFGVLSTVALTFYGINKLKKPPPKE